MRLLNNKLSWFVTGLLVWGCVEPYSPAAITNAPHLLVVDGFLNATDGSINAKLSRTISLTDEGPPPKEINATVILEDQDGGTTALNEILPGEYSASGITVNPELTYRLRIETAGQMYLSDFVQVKVTPEIESLEYSPKADQLEVMVTAGDPTGESKFYRWKYQETFEYTAAYQSGWKLENGEVVVRQPDDFIYRCWGNEKSTRIMVASSSGLTQDRINDYVITAVPRASIKLMHHYSIEVQQQTLTPEGYAYWQGLYKTTEDVGGLFDPLPGQVSGNFYNAADAKEVVVGFFSAATVSTKRMFVKIVDDLPEGYPDYTFPFCPLDTVDLPDVPTLSSRTILYQAIYAQGMPVIIGYTFAEPICIDCQYLGGSTTKPDFWP